MLYIITTVAKYIASPQDQIDDIITVWVLLRTFLTFHHYYFSPFWENRPVKTGRKPENGIQDVSMELLKEEVTC